MKMTEALAEMCKISDDKIVLDVGCGYGRTVCYLSQNYGCKVVGIDLSERMIKGAREKARKECVGDLVHFQIGDAVNTHFQDGSFDAVISEGTTVLTDKSMALREYARITKRGGYIGLNELSWRKKPLKGILKRTFTDLQGTRPLGYDEWTKLLVDSGLKDIESRTYKYKSTSWDIIKSLGLRSLIKVCIVYLTNIEIRRWINKQEAIFREFSDYWGYGLYVGRK
jgi:ubiquinone/menaquinone biosynthesis C-methylase UbiE